MRGASADVVFRKIDHVRLQVRFPARTLSERGFIHQISDEAGLDELFAKEIVTAYIGFDATATSLHIGNLIQIMMLYWMQETGHRPIALMGGGTSMIGDPSFRDERASC